MERRPKRGNTGKKREKEEDSRHVIEECEIAGGPNTEGLTELKTIMEKRGAIQDGEERR